MPPLAPVPSVVKIQLKWNDGSDTDTSNTLYWSYTGDAPSGAECTALAGSVADLVTPHVAVWNDAVAFTGVGVIDLSSDSGGVGEATRSAAGTIGGNVLAGGTCLVASYSLNRRYRGGKPRNYLPWGSSVSLQGPQAWNADFLSAAQTALADITQGISGTTAGGCTLSNHVNVSYYSGSTGSVSPDGSRGKTTPKRRPVPLVNDITGFLLVPFPGSQRRRNR